MSCRGVHFSLPSAEVERLREIRDEEERIEHLSEVIEEDYFENRRDDLAESDKAWDAIQRCLDPGGADADEGPAYPLGHFILGGESLCSEEGFLMRLKRPEHVRDVAAAASAITEAELRRRYDAIDPDDYDGELGDDDFQYAWENFLDIRRLFQKAAAEGRFVLFTVDQ